MAGFQKGLDVLAVWSDILTLNLGIQCVQISFTCCATRWNRLRNQCTGFLELKLNDLDEKSGLTKYLQSIFKIPSQRKTPFQK